MNPFEQICSTFEKTLNAGSVRLRDVLGQKTLVVNFGADKCEDGTMFSILLCTQIKGNNSPLRRRPVAFILKPATDSTANLKRLLTPIKSALKLLKDNSSIFTIRIGKEYACTILSCYQDVKDELDGKRRSYTKYEEKPPRSLEDAEIQKRKRNWNLINYNIQRLYLLLDVDLCYGKCKLNKYRYPELFICVTKVCDVQEINILRKVKNISSDKSEYSVIGSGFFWNCMVDLDESSICREGGTQFIEFDNEHNPMELIYLCIHDGGDLDCFDKRYVLGNHASTNFCVCCHSKEKYGSTKQGTSYRTCISIQSNATKCQDVKQNKVVLQTKQTALQYSKGVKETPADPYPGASRITHSFLHINMGMCTAFLEMQTQYVRSLKEHALDKLRVSKMKQELQNMGHKLHALHREITLNNQKNLTSKYTELYDEYNILKLQLSELQQKINEQASPNYVKLQFEALNKYQVLRNLFFEKLEGTQARIYRQKFKVIAKMLELTDFYTHMAEVIGLYDRFMCIAGGTDPEIPIEKIDEAKQVLLDFEKQWKYSKMKLGIKKTLFISCSGVYVFMENTNGFHLSNQWNHFKKYAIMCSIDIKDREEFSN